MTPITRQATALIDLPPAARGLHEVTERLTGWVAAQGVVEGLLTVFVRHSSASLLIQENADPDVRTDLMAWFERAVPEDPDRYVHVTEGPDDMPAHIRAALTQTHLAIPVIGGRLALGTWQGVYLFEHRRRRHRRQLALHLIGG